MSIAIGALAEATLAPLVDPEDYFAALEDYPVPGIENGLSTAFEILLP